MAKTNKGKKKVYAEGYTYKTKSGKTVKVPPLVPETELEKKRFDAALRRRQLSLVLAGKMKANEATELKAIFD